MIITPTQNIFIQLEPHVDDHGDGQEAEQDHREHQPGVPGDTSLGNNGKAFLEKQRTASVDFEW